MENKDETRRQRGLQIAQTSRIEKSENGFWKVPSQSGHGWKKEKVFKPRAQGFGMAKNGIRKYEAIYFVSYNKGNGYSGPESERKKHHIRTYDIDVAREKANEHLARVRKSSNVKSATLEGIVLTRK